MPIRSISICDSAGCRSFLIQDIGFQPENIVYLELLRRGYEVHVGTLLSGEVDFVAQRRSERIYIQVCETLLDVATRGREVAPLERIGDVYPKLILTRDSSTVGITETGVRIELVATWLRGSTSIACTT